MKTRYVLAAIIVGGALIGATESPAKSMGEIAVDLGYVSMAHEVCEYKIKNMSSDEFYEMAAVFVSGVPSGKMKFAEGSLQFLTASGNSGDELACLAAKLLFPDSFE